MIETALKIFEQGGYPLLFAIASIAANIAQWRDRLKLQNDLLEVNKMQHEAQLDGIKMLISIREKVEKCPFQK